MPLDKNTLEQLAAHVDDAERERREIVKLTDAHPQLTLDEAYDIQYLLRGRRLARGERLAGLKMGLTAFAKMKQMGVETPIYGFMTDRGAHGDDAEIRCSELIHPKIEPEIAFITRRELKGTDCTTEQALDAVESVLMAVEVIDSRFKDFKFDLPSVVADNTSAARHVVGKASRSPQGLDLAALSVTVRKNGQAVAQGTGDAVLGHPAASLAMLVKLLAKRGESLPAGSFVMTGGITEAVAVAPGDSISVVYEHLGTLNMRFV